MRKLLNIISLSAVVLFASCDMDKIPQGTLDSKEAFKDVQSVEYLEKGAYALLRGCYGIQNVMVSDIQMDYVNAISGYSNTYGEVYKWTFQQNDYDVAAVWNSCYGAISQYNFILDGMQTHFYENDDENLVLTDADVARLDLVKARLYLMRAMTYSILAERFCADYDEATAKNQYSGVPLVLHFVPGEKPNRATLFEVYESIVKDLDLAKKGLNKVKGSANSIYLNKDCVTAMQAHVYLQMDMYPEALTAANLLTGSPVYSLAASEDEFGDVWTYDRGKEIIFKFAASKTETPAAYGYSFYLDNQSGMALPAHVWTPDYIPTQDLIDSFEAGDYRATSWFYHDTQKKDNAYAGQFIIDPTYVLISKFPGNPDLRTGQPWNYLNTWKVFRLAEMYLIAAEAATHTGGDAKAPLNALRTHRGLAELPAVTMADIKEERYKELMLEGFRMVDLKRWGDGVKRGISQFASFYSITLNNTLEFEKEDYLSIMPARDLNMPATNFRFVWPIPYNEIFANQNLKNQQNPGWEK